MAHNADGGRRNRTTRPYGDQPVAEASPAEARLLDELAPPDETAAPDEALEHRSTSRYATVDPEGAPPPPQRRGGGQLRPDNVEIDLVQVDDAADMDGRWRTLEIWTQKSVYAVDADLRCFAVIDRASGNADTRHRFIGARLMGGEHKSDGQRAFSYPVPVPGGDAVFQIISTSSKPGVHAGAFGHTSAVERVLLRIRVTRVPTASTPTVAGSTDALWADIRKTLG
jgi:hypothetical protein